MQGLENFWFRKNLIGMVGIIYWCACLQDGHQLQQHSQHYNHRRHSTYIGEVEAAPSTGFKGPPPQGAAVSMSYDRRYCVVLLL